MISLAIVGSRNFMDYPLMKQIIAETLEKWNIPLDQIYKVLSGGAKGADLLASKWAKLHKIQMT